MQLRELIGEDMKRGLMSLTEDLKIFLFIFFNPRRLFNHIKTKPRPFIPALIFLSLILLTYLMILNLFREKPHSNFKEVNMILLSLFACIFYISILYLKTVIVSIGIRILKGNYDFDLLYIAFIYCLTPFLFAFSIFLLFPWRSFNILNILISVLAIIFARLSEIVLSIVAISSLSNLSYWKSILVFLPWLIIWIFIGL